jgi:outer membrane protein assembly factor BamA
MPYFIYSYGFGIKIQVPMMPLRFWFGKKMIYDDGFKTISGYNFQFSIGDIHY